MPLWAIIRPTGSSREGVADGAVQTGSPGSEARRRMGEGCQAATHHPGPGTRLIPRRQSGSLCPFAD